MDVGTYSNLKLKIDSNTKLVDASGMFITAGFIESHAHVITSGFALSSVGLCIIFKFGISLFEIHGSFIFI